MFLCIHNYHREIRGTGSCFCCLTLCPTYCNSLSLSTPTLIVSQNSGNGSEWRYMNVWAFPSGAYRTAWNLNHDRRICAAVCRDRLSPLGGGDEWFSLGFGSELALLFSLYYFYSRSLSALYLISVVLSLSHDFDLWTSTSCSFQLL